MSAKFAWWNTPEKKKREGAVTEQYLMNKQWVQWHDCGALQGASQVEQASAMTSDPQPSVACYLQLVRIYMRQLVMLETSLMIFKP